MPHVRHIRKTRTLDELHDELKQHLPELRERYGVTYLGIFGSFVRGEQQLASDIDLLVEFDRAGSLLDLIHLQNVLEDLLGIRVDLVEKSGLKPAIRPFVLAEVVPV